MILLFIAFPFMVLVLILVILGILFLIGTILGALADSNSITAKKSPRLSKQTALDPSPLDEVPVEPTASETSEIIPAEIRIKSAIISKHGLYPQEVLMLAYAPSFYTESNSFQGFWWYKYGVSDVDKGLRSLLDRGFLQIGSLQSAIENETTAILKDELRSRVIKIGGKKAEVVLRLLEEVPFEELNARFPRRTYQLTSLGKQTLEDEGYVLYIHRHQIEDLDIWSLNKIIHEPANRNLNLFIKSKS